jgi:hypothetical protein
MSVTPEDLLFWAETANASTEPDKRAIISRAYYAAFHRCLEWHGSRIRFQSTFQAQNAGEHETLIQKLLHPNLGNPNRQQQLSLELGRRLRDLKALRVLADYRLRQSIPTGLEDQASDEAADILRLAI